MRLMRVSGLVVPIAILFVVGGCQTGGSKSDVSRAHSRSGDSREEISGLLDEYMQGLLNKDLAALDRIWADDLTFVNLRGELLSKQNRIDNIKSGATAFKSIQVSDERVRMYGQAAVATCQVDLEAQYSGHEGSGSYRVTTVWARPKRIWQMVAVQMTQITR
jgi:ketosteroid isomerase-like protein